MRYMIESIFVVLIITGTGSTLARLVGWWSSRPKGVGGHNAARPDPLGLRLQALIHLVWAAWLLVHFVFLATLSDAKEIVPWLANLGVVIALGALVTAVLSLWSGVRRELEAIETELRG